MDLSVKLPLYWKRSVSMSQTARAVHDRDLVLRGGAGVEALTRLLRETLDQILPEQGWIDAARALRARWRAEGVPMKERFKKLVRAFAAR